MSDREVDNARMLAGLFFKFDRHRQMLARLSELGTADLRLLWLFTDGRSRTLRQMAEELNLEQSTINRQANAALKTKILDRHQETNGSAYLYRATPYGLAEFERSLNTTLSVYQSAIDGLDSRKKAFFGLMDEFTDRFGEAAEAAYDSSGSGSPSESGEGPASRE